ncbi:MAG: L,D-transpeptidase [Chthoniobacterales bacterium]
MRIISRLCLFTGLAAFALLTSCSTLAPTTKTYHVVAHKPHDPSKVRVLVSLSKQNVYVMEGDRCLMAVATSVGMNNHPTPKGHFTISNKIKHKRSGSYGFRVQGENIRPAEAGSNIPGRYVGYPMGYWCEFAPAYGFHQGFVHPVPRTHGCLRLHGEAAPKFFALVHEGTPVYIANSQPEDATIGPKIERVDDSKSPDPDPKLMVTSGAFQEPTGPLLVD